MKRSELTRRSPLKRSPFRRRRKPPVFEPGRAEWKQPAFGACQCCGRVGWLIRHHVIYEQHCRREHGDPWNLANAMQLGAESTCRCHTWQHSGYKRIPLEAIPEAAIAFAVDLFGEARAAEYLRRRYDTSFLLEMAA